MFILVCIAGYAQDELVINVEKPGLLENLLPEGNVLGTINVVKIKGELYNSDFEAFQKWKEYSFSLDLSECIIDTIPQKVFESFYIDKIILPKTLIRIEEGAFKKGILGEINMSETLNLEYIGKDAFYACTRVKKWIFPIFYKIICIEENAFFNCVNLNEIDLTNCNRLKIIKRNTFFHSYLKKVKLPIFLEEIEEYAFADNMINTIDIPASIQKIGDKAFAKNMNHCLKTLVIRSKTPLILENNKSPFEYDQYENTTLVVPKGCRSLYQSAIVWSQFKNIREVGLCFIKVKNDGGGGSVKIGDEIIQSGEISVPEANDVQVSFIPDKGYYLKQVKLGNEDITKQVKDNVLTISQIIENKELTVVFEKELYSVKVSYNEGGTVKVNNQDVTSGTSVSVDAGTDVKLAITLNEGFKLQQVLIGTNDVTKQAVDGVLTISKISESKDVIIRFEQIETITYYTVKVNYNNGGTVKIGDELITSGSSKTVTASENVTVSIVPNTGYHVKCVKLGESDVTTSIKDNQLQISSISENKELTVEFELTTYSVKATYDNGGIVKVNNEAVNSGTAKTVNALTNVTISIIPNTGYHVKNVQLNKKDVTDKIENNKIVINSIEADQELTVTFEVDTPKTYSVKIIHNTGGIVKVNNEVIANETVKTVNALTDVQVSMIPDDGYLLKQVKLGAVDVTDQIVNNTLTISEISGDREVTIVFEKGTPITCSVKVSYSNGGTVKVNNHFVENGTFLTVQKSAKVSVSFIPDYGYYLKQVLSEGKDVTLQVVGNLLEVKSVTKDMEIVAIFEKIPLVSCIVDIIGNGTVKVNGQAISKSLDVVSVEKGSAVTFSFIPDTKYKLGSVLLNNQNVTGQLKNNEYRITSLTSNVTCQVEFVLIDTPTSIKQVGNTAKRVYRSAPKCLAISGFEAGVPVYVYDGNGRLVVLKTIRDNVEKVEVPADGLYFVRIGKESFKVIL